MKKICLIPVLCIAIAACSKIEETNHVEVTQGGGATTVTFAGGSVSTKVSIGDKVDGAYQGLWASGDAIAVYKADGTSLGAASLNSGAGENVGTFSLATDPSLADGATVRVIYPATASYSGENTIPTEQTASRDLSGRTVAWSDALVTSSTSVVGFTLYHAPAIIKIQVASTEYAGATVDHVIFRSIGNGVSGTFTANYSANTVTAMDTEDYVKVSTSLTLSSTAQEIWFTALPTDLTGEEIDIAFHITTGSQTFYLPVAFKGGELKSNTVNVFSLTALSADNCTSWYEPFDTRVMDSPTWAYGDANTFFIQCKNGATYTGATYVENDNVPSSVDISIKARGDFLKVVNPTGATFKWAVKPGTSTVYAMRTSGYSASGVDPTKYTYSYDGKQTVTVTNNGAYAGSPILLMKKGGKVIWSFTFWNIAADGTSIEPVTIGGYKLANMDIGQATTNISTWVTNLNGSNPDVLYRTVNRYQFGRHMPVFFEYYWSVLNADAGETGNVPAIYGPVTLEEYISNPVGIVANQTVDTDLNPWCSDMTNNVWGGLGTESGGEKSVMDPCPKGYRVADKVTLQAVKNATVTAETTSGAQGLYSDGNLFLRAGTCTAKTTNDKSNVHVISTEGGANTGTSGVGKWWSNYIAGSSSTSAFVLNASTSAFSESNYLVRSYSCSVRCQVDDDNR